MADDIAHLVEIAKKELALEVDLQQIGAFALGDWDQWVTEKRILADFVDSATTGQSVPVAEEWHKQLHRLGDARKMLCNNAAVALRAKIAEAKKHLSSEKADLVRVEAALEDVKQAHESAHGAAELISTLLEVKTLVEVIENPEKMKEELQSKFTGSPGDVIEAGIKDLGQYYEQVTLASHGFASFEELAHYAKAQAQNVVHAGEAFDDVYRPYLLAEKDYEIPVP
jgi:hypothetical protein